MSLTIALVSQYAYLPSKVNNIYTLLPLLRDMFISAFVQMSRTEEVQGGNSTMNWNI